jgi:hypothetical protein
LKIKQSRSNHIGYNVYSDANPWEKEKKKQYLCIMYAHKVPMYVPKRQQERGRGEERGMEEEGRRRAGEGK